MGMLILLLIISVVIVLTFIWLLCRENDSDAGAVFFETVVIIVFSVTAALAIRGLVKYGEPAPEYEKVITTDTAPVIDTTFTTTNGITDTTYTVKIKKVL